MSGFDLRRETELDEGNWKTRERRSPLAGVQLEVQVYGWGCRWKTREQEQPEEPRKRTEKSLEAVMIPPVTG
jgi:hypothetical protein